MTRTRTHARRSVLKLGGALVVPLVLPFSVRARGGANDALRLGAIGTGRSSSAGSRA